MENLRQMLDTTGVNAFINFTKGAAGESFFGTDVNDVSIGEFYDRVLQDTLKVAKDNYVHMGYAEEHTLPQGYREWKTRTFGSLTAHDTPLKEGVPPISDQTWAESRKGTHNQYGRFMEFTDKMDWTTLDPIMTKYTIEMSDLAVRTKERLCRKEMLSTTFITFANLRSNVGELRIGDMPTFTQFRLQALVMQRLLVKPINGNFEILISPEMQFDLLEDQLVKDWMTYSHSARPIENGEIPPIAGLKFISHMLDEFTYGYELSNPGEWYNGSNNMLAVYYVDEAAGKTYYINISEDEDLGAGVRPRNVFNAVTGKSVAGAQAEADYDYTANDSNHRLGNGSFIPERIIWDIAGWKAAHDGQAAVTCVTHNNDATHSLDGGTTDIAVTNAQDWRQVPVHTAIMLGQGAIATIGIDGHKDAKMYFKEKGSAGVLDPINQRQSVGFKIDTLGFMTMREEAIHLFKCVPSHAPLTQREVWADMDRRGLTADKRSAQK